MPSDYIYRVIVRHTHSLQPGSGATCWSTTVKYCGPSLRDGRIAYLREHAEDYSGSFGNRCRRTSIERFSAEPDVIDDTTAEPVE